jgi:hypothetical protein
MQTRLTGQHIIRGTIDLCIVNALIKRVPPGNRASPSIIDYARVNSSRIAKQRRATAILELVLVLPILVMLVLAVVQFGLFFTKMQQVALASRTGVEAASQTVGLSTVDGDPVPTDVINAVTQQLESSGIEYCSIRLEHNVGGTQVELVSPTSGACDCEPSDNIDPPLPPGEYVRLTVGVPMSELMPNCMGSLGFDISNRIVTSTTLFRYELTP